jgi:hypothetical protein
VLWARSNAAFVARVQNKKAGGKKMTKLGILSLGFAGLFMIPGCMAEPPDETEEAASELAVAPDSIVTNGNGFFHVIRLANTQLCLQPQGGSTDDVLVELHTCDPRRTAPEQNWLLRPQPGTGRISLVNQKSGKCLYNDVAPPLFNGKRPISHASCFIFGTNRITSNALWKQRINSGFSSFESELQDRDTNFCLDVPFFPFDHVTFQNFRCNGTPAQSFVLE